MPIEEISDYPEKMTEFELHWGSVNAFLGGDPATDFKLSGGYTQAQFVADKVVIETALTALIVLENDLWFARSDRDDLRVELRQRLILFRENVLELLPNSRFARSLPETPAERADQDKHLQALDDAANLWLRINTTPPPEVAPALILRGNYTLAQFNAAIATLRQHFETVKAAERDQQDARGQRDLLLTAAYDRMVQYRGRLPLVLEPTNPLLASMPRLRPAENGGGEGGGGAGGVPAAPGAPMLTNTGVGQVSVNWSPVAGALSFKIYQQTGDENQPWVEVGAAMAGPATLTSLPPGATIRVRLTALNEHGESEPGPHAEITLPA